MKTALQFIKSREAQRSAEIVVIFILLLLVFSVAGVPMILLSTFSPSLISEDPQEDKVDGYGVDTFDARVAV